MFDEEEPTLKSTSRAVTLRDRLRVLRLRRLYRIEDLRKAEDTDQIEETAIVAAAATRAAMASINDSDPPLTRKKNYAKAAKILAALATLGAAAKELIDFLTH